MHDWIKRWESIRKTREAATSLTVHRPSSEISAKYSALHKYLENRYADVVVLSFSQIEDLLGFPLPALARSDGEWWTAGAASTVKSPYSDAWRLAGRTAKPNLLAKNVVFERALSLR